MQEYIKEYKIGNFNINPNVYMASMSGVSDMPFRLLCRKLSKNRVSLAVSEFISVESAQGNLNPKKMTQIRFHEDESPFCMQFFGHNPKHMAIAAKKAEAMGVDFVEINAGCPAPKVVGHGGGSALLKDFDRFREIMMSVVEAVSVPVLVKTRIGWDDNYINILDTLKLVESCGVSQLTIHGRHRMQGYRGEANWDVIKDVVKHANIPIIGNGDIRTPEQAIERLKYSKASGVALGRAMMHNPWLLGQMADAWEGKIVKMPSMIEQQDMFEIYHQLLSDQYESEKSLLGRMKQLTARFTNSIIDAKEFRSYILRSPTIEEFFKRLHDFYSWHEKEGLEVQYRPDLVENLNGTKTVKIISGNDYLGIKKKNYAVQN